MQMHGCMQKVGQVGGRSLSNLCFLLLPQGHHGPAPGGEHRCSRGAQRWWWRRQRRRRGVCRRQAGLRLCEARALPACLLHYYFLVTVACSALSALVLCFLCACVNVDGVQLLAGGEERRRMGLLACLLAGMHELNPAGLPRCRSQRSTRRRSC